MACKFHTRYERLRIFLYGKTPVDLLIPCCRYPDGKFLFLQEKRFKHKSLTDIGTYEAALPEICGPETCPEYTPGENVISEIVAGTWRKCPLGCLTCFNSQYDNHGEAILSREEMNDYLFSLGEIGAYVKKTNSDVLFQIGGSGDIFYSENYRNMLMANLPSFGIDRIHLLTNMQFWTDGTISCISPDVRGAVCRITFSVDGTDPALYEKIRAGSSWGRLLRSYRRCRKSFPDVDYRIIYTVSTLNFHDFRNVYRLHHYFPEVSVIYLNMARDWVGRPETAKLVCSPAQTAEVFEWLSQNKGGDGCRIEAYNA